MHEHGIVICNIKGKWEETLNSHRKGLTNDGIFVQQQLFKYKLKSNFLM